MDMYTKLFSEKICKIIMCLFSIWLFLKNHDIELYSYQSVSS